MSDCRKEFNSATTVRTNNSVAIKDMPLFLLFSAIQDKRILGEG